MNIGINAERGVFGGGYSKSIPRHKEQVHELLK
jgi:hypothetical protein